MFFSKYILYLLDKRTTGTSKHMNIRSQRSLEYKYHDFKKNKKNNGITNFLSLTHITILSCQLIYSNLFQ